MSHAAVPQILSTEAFEASVAEISPKVTVFDCDGTLWAADAGSSFLSWSIETGLLSPDAVQWIQDRYRGYNKGEVSELTICSQMVQVYNGLHDDQMRDAARHFFQLRIAPSIFPEMQRLVADLQRKDTILWAVSSTCNWVIEEGLRSFDINPDRVLATTVEIVSGMVTDHVLDTPTDEGKVTALARVGVVHPDAVFGNSEHDVAMLAIAQHAFPVNPTPGLILRSTHKGWPIYFPASVRPL